MFAKMKTGTKVMAGFGVMLFILMSLGGAGYVMFGRVQSNVTTLEEHNLKAVKNSTGVERAAFQSILDEKNYVLYKKDETYQKAKQDMAELAGNLDQVDKIAEQFNNADLAKKSKEVRELATQFGKLLDEGVAALKANKAGEDTMNAKGTLVNNEAEAYMVAKKAEYMEAKTSLAIVNKIEALTWQMRWAHQKMQNSKDRDGLDVVTKAGETLMGCYDKLEKMRPDAEEKQQIAHARKSTQEYTDAVAQECRDNHNGLKGDAATELRKRIAEAGDAIGKAATDYLAAKGVKVDTLANAVFIVAEIADEANATRLAEKGYILTQDQKYWTALNEHITKLSKLYGDLRKVSLTQEDQQRINRADKATQEYLVAAKSWVENDSKLHNTIMPEMKKGGETVLATAQTAENDAWKASEEAGNAVSSIVVTSKTIIVVALLVGVLAGFGLALVISKSISKVLRNLIGEAKRLAEAAVAGKLQTRGNPDLVSLEFRPIVEGVNDTLDAVIGPLNVAAEYVDRISKGDIPQKITDNYNGDFNEIKNNLNQCIDAVNLLVADAVMLAKAGVEGQLATRADASKHQGDFQKIVRGVNETLDSVVGPLNDAARCLKAMASKDFTKMIEADYSGDFKALKDNINAVTQNIKTAIEQITESASQFTEGSRTIAESAQTLAQGAQTQSASVEEMSASTEELARSVNAVKENANESTKVAERASQLAEQGGKAVQQSIASMEQIRNSSQQISEIIQVISEIASQTNLLALNAAIEAARAGEHGMGFAVVADEVRKLAERSNQAAREISSLIKESTKRVEEGAQLSTQTGESLKQIIKAAEDTASKIAEIATATMEQAASAQEVSKAIQGVSAVTEQAAAGSEQMASSSEELGAQAATLRELVSEFRVGGNSSQRNTALV
jgi:methyl-accepting chemotaxis protein